MLGLQVLETDLQILESERAFDSDESDYNPGESQNGIVVPQTSLKSLCCSSVGHFDPQVLRFVLSNSPHLTKLQTKRPRLTISPEDVEKWAGYVMSFGSIPDIRPVVVANTLPQCAKNLRELVLLTHMLLGSEFAETSINLSWLHQLKQLSISTHLLSDIQTQGFTVSNSNDCYLPSQDWYQRLPSGLQTLQIQFGHFQGLFWELEELRSLDGYAHVNLTDTSFGSY